jgi:hypothetical protein
MPEAGTQTSLAHTGTGGSDCRGMGRADAETEQRVSSGRRRKSGEWRVASGEWRVASGEWRVAEAKWRMADARRMTSAG